MIGIVLIIVRFQNPDMTETQLFLHCLPLIVSSVVFTITFAIAAIYEGE